MAKHPIVHVEIPVEDREAASRFYSELFGWRIQPMPEIDYALFEAGDGPGGGFPTADGDLYRPGSVLVYVGTDDIEASLATVEALGGTTVLPKTEIPGHGWFGIFSDPSGNRIALYTGTGQ